MRFGIVLATAVALGARGPAAGAPPRLVATPDLIARVRGPTVSIHDARGRLLARLPPQTSNIVAQDNRRAQAAAIERVFDEAEVPEEARDEDDAADLLDDELPRRLRSPAPPGDAGERDAGQPPAFAMGDDRGLFVIAGGEIWRVEPGQRPRLVARAPAGIRDAGATRAGRLFVARDREILASDDGGQSFAVVDRPAVRPLALAVDPEGVRLAVRGDGRLDLIALAPGAPGWVLRPPVALRGVAFCAGRLLVLAADGVHDVGGAADPPARARRIFAAPSPPEAALACSSLRAVGGSGASFLLYRPGLRLVHGGRVVLAARPGTPIDAAVDLGGRVVVDGPGGLFEINAEGTPSALAAAWPSSGAGGRASGTRALAGVLPFVSLLGRVEAAEVRGAAGVMKAGRAWAVGALAEWRLPPAHEPRRRLAQAPESADGHEDLVGFSPPMATAVLRADAEADCLGAARAAAVRLAQADPEQARSLITRAGRSAWLPELRVRAERRVGRSESVDVKPAATSEALGFDAAVDVRYEVRATWDLPRLVFNPDELGAVHQAAKIADMRREIESQVNRLYFERRRLLAAPGGATPDEVTTWQIRIEEIEAELDTLSAGAFSGCRGRRVAGPPEVR